MKFPGRFQRRHCKDTADAVELRAALNKAQAVIWFDLDGNILSANENFLRIMGYGLDEVVGKHHRIFVDRREVAKEDYARFWEKLARGERHHGEFARVTKGQETVWIEASYNPVLDENGRPVKVVKFAIDVTESKLRAADMTGQIAAISKAQAVIEFDLDGTIRTANENFLSAVDYALDDIVGKHHRMFVDPAEAATGSYRDFWTALAAGKFQAGEFKRLGRNGREIWIQASYNPILDANGTPFKVVKFASDVTQEKLRSADAQGQLSAISKAQAVIEFDLDGTIRTANQNFLDALGYSLAEIAGRHHSMFVEGSEVALPAYRAFWENLARGQYQAAEFKRIAKGGREIWIQASYNPIFDMAGRPIKVVKFATDVTARRMAVDALSRGLQSLADGDLSIRLPQSIDGDFAPVRDAFNQSLERLADLVTGILETSDVILREATGIAASSGDLAKRGERQAATVEETSAAMEEISAGVKSTASNAETADSAARTAAGLAETGCSVVTSTIDAMTRIEESAGKIASIIQVIDSIAFQTNLLALNAGVEAARAGDAGKGFAVVASEVRALAQRSTEAARDIGQLIASSNKEVSQGAALVAESGESLQLIVKGVSEVVESIAGITMASREQATGIGEVSQAVSDIDATTQHTAALAEESSAAAEELRTKASDLRSLVSHFRATRQEAERSMPRPVPDHADGRTPRLVDGPRTGRAVPQAVSGGTRGNVALAVEKADWSEF